MRNLLFAFIGLLLISSCNRIEESKKVTSITISPSSPKVAVGLPQQLTTTIVPTDAEKKEVTWSSSDEKIATVDAAGIVTGRAKGAAVITATATDGSNTKGTVTITVTVNATSIAISPANPSVDVGQNLTLTVVVAPSDAAQTVTWASSDPSKATIDPATGVVNGVAAGTTTITATAADGSGITQSATLTVNSNNASITALTLGEENFIVTVPAEGAIRVANAPRSIATNLTRLKVNITVAANAAIKMGNNAFISGTVVDFTTPITFTVTAQDGRTVKNYTAAILPYNATDNPYGIYTVWHLVDVNNGLTASFLLKNNIDLPNANADGAAATGISDYATAGWRAFHPFSGTFDGGSFSINNFYTNRRAGRVGLFETLTIGGEIQNLGVNGIVNGPAVIGNNDAESAQHTGILVGYNQGIIDKCYVTGNVSATAATANFAVMAGGLVGRNDDGTITNSYAAGNISASCALGSMVGGLAGHSVGAIIDSYATGNVTAGMTSADTRGVVAAGGLAGICSVILSDNTHRTNLIRNSYATGNVSVTAPASVTAIFAGGLVGRSVPPDNSVSALHYVNCFRNSNAVIKKNNQDAAAALNDESISGITAKILADMQKDDFKTSLNAGVSVWGREDSKNNKLPYLIGVGVGK